MNKKILIFLSLWCLFFPTLLKAANQEIPILSTTEIMERQQQSLDLRELEEFMQNIEKDISEVFPGFSFSQILEDFKQGKFSFAPGETLKRVGNYFWREVILNLSLLGKLLIIAVVAAILQTLQSAFTKGTVARLAHYLCFLAIITLTISSLKIALDSGLTSINKMITFMNLLLPILLVLLTTIGGLTTTALFQPFLLVFLTFMAAFAQKFIFPLIFLTVVLAITNNLSTNLKMSHLLDLFKQITKISLGVVLTLFVGLISLEGVLGTVVDGVTLRTAKYMTGAFIPVVGSMFADALEAIIGGSLLLKNALGLTGVLILGVITLFPLLKILALVLIYRLAAALLQLLDDSLLANTLGEMSSCLFLSFAAVATVALLFFITITIIVSTANFTVMFR